MATEKDEGNYQAISDKGSNGKHLILMDTQGHKLVGCFDYFQRINIVTLMLFNSGREIPVFLIAYPR